ncbi:MAG: phosphotransferase family protein [Thermoleophilaceae bacterium]
MPIETDLEGPVRFRPFDPALILPASSARVVVLVDEVDRHLAGDALRGEIERYLAGQPLGEQDDAAEQEGPLLAVASTSRVDEALATGADMIILEGGDVHRRLSRDGFVVTRYVPLPNRLQPDLLLPLDQPVAVRYALSRWRSSVQLDASWQARYARRLRDGVVGRLSRHIPVRGRTLVTVASRRAGAPQAVAAAARVLQEPLVAWLPTFTTGLDPDSRNVVHLFARRRKEPSWVIKLARERGHDAIFVHEEAVLMKVRESGGALAERAPRLVARTEVGGRSASVETAAAGTGLDRLLAGRTSRRTKLKLLQAVVAWLEQVARETLAPASALGPERSRLADQVLPPWRDSGVTDELVVGLPPLPAVFLHGDMWEENVVVGRDGFMALDWERARPHGFPLWDLASFASMTLGVLDGARSVDERAGHFVELWSGVARSSPILFRWLRSGAEAAGVPAEAVPAIVTLRWLDDPVRARREAAGSATVDARSSERLLDRLPHLWLDEPALGPGWRAWREAERPAAA